MSKCNKKMNSINDNFILISLYDPFTGNVYKSKTFDGNLSTLILPSREIVLTVIVSINKYK